MALHLEYESPSNPGTFVAVDFVAQKACDFKLQISYSSPAILTWKMLTAEHSLPIPFMSFVVFWDDAVGSFADPLFEGHVYKPEPAGANEIHYTAFDPTFKAGQEISILSGSSVFPTSYCRSVYNVAIETDPDKSCERNPSGLPYTIGQIMTDLLTDAYAQLVPIYAAPPVVVGGPAYDSSDFAAMTMKPQDKVVFQAQTLASGLEQMLQYHPQYRMIFIPGTGAGRRVWRFRDVLAAPQVTLTLNKTTDAANIVMSKDLRPSLQGRATAYRIDGPPVIVGDIANTPTTLLGEGTTWTTQQRLNINAGTSDNLGTPGSQNVYRVFQVADPAKRRFAKTLPTEVLVTTSKIQSTDLVKIFVRKPTLLASWDNGSTFTPIVGTYYDSNDGKVYAPFQILRRDGSNHIVWPDLVRFVFAYHSTPLFVRYPTTGFTGTAYTVGNLAFEKREYDEGLASGWERAVPVISAERTVQFTKLCQQKLDAIKDLVWAGGVTIAGLNYDYLRLNKRVNVAAVAGDGTTPLTTGWESANAILTDVEYDFSGTGLTTLTFNSDHLEFCQTDASLLRRMLKIRASRLIEVNNSFVDGGRGNLGFRNEREYFEQEEQDNGVWW